MVDVTADVHARFLLWRLHYLIEELTVWRGGALQTLAWNYRYLLGGAPKRQQWDVYRRGPAGFEAWRIQGPPETLEARHPGFGARWDPARFALPWLDDYWRAQPTRRPDLDPPGQAPLPPMAELFAFARPGPQTLQILLPGFKRDKVAEVAVEPGGRARVRHPLLDEPARLDAEIDANGLARATFSGSAAAGSVHGEIARTGCE